LCLDDAAVARLQISSVDHGRSVALHVGDELVVRLPENPTTGYRWQLDSSGSGFLALRNDEFELPADVAMGASGTRILTFQATSPGVGHLHLELRREWEQGQPPIQDFPISVLIDSQ
jgi:inhibitor of cysteine peptidase